MTDTRRHISDEDLTAYLDGEAPDDLRREIEQALSEDDAFGARLSALDLPLGQLQQESARALQDAPALTLPPAQIRRAGGFSVAAALAIGIGIGVAIAPAPPEANSGWIDYVAAYQALYVQQTISDMPPVEASAQLAGLSDVVGRDLSQVAQLPGLEYRRGQELGFKGKPLIQIAYLANGTTPVALCVIENGKAEHAIKSMEVEGLAAASWSDGTHSYLLIGGQDQSFIDTTAAATQALL